jgi:hypothetical protein
MMALNNSNHNMVVDFTEIFQEGNNKAKQQMSKTSTVPSKKVENESLIFPEIFSPSAFRYWVPNGITILSCITGLSSIKWSFEDHYPIAVICILIAGILDTLDGPAARALGGNKL